MPSHYEVEPDIAFEIRRLRGRWADDIDVANMLMMEIQAVEGIL
ncbi:hypothetical protein [Jiella sp. M17.18]